MLAVRASRFLASLFFQERASETLAMGVARPLVSPARHSRSFFGDASVVPRAPHPRATPQNKPRLRLRLVHLSLATHGLRPGTLDFQGQVSVVPVCCGCDAAGHSGASRLSPSHRLPLSLPLNTLFSALYQLQLVPTEEARKHIPPQFKIVSLFG